MQEHCAHRTASDCGGPSPESLLGPRGPPHSGFSQPLLPAGWQCFCPREAQLSAFPSPSCGPSVLAGEPWESCHTLQGRGQWLQVGAVWPAPAPLGSPWAPVPPSVKLGMPTPPPSLPTHLKSSSLGRLHSSWGPAQTCPLSPGPEGVRLLPPSLNAYCVRALHWPRRHLCPTGCSDSLAELT